MRSIVVGVCMVCTPLAESAAQSPARTSAQVAVGTIATPVAFFGGGLLTRRLARGMGASDSTARRAAYVGAYVSTWASAGITTSAIGQGGSTVGAFAGSAAGLGVSWLTVQLGNALYDNGKRHCGPLCWALGAGAVAFPSVGAAVGYRSWK